MAEDIPIITGDPLEIKDGASFTCFVLPFRYRPVLLSDKGAEILSKNKACFQEVDKRTPEWINRMRYFTGETAQVLYDHARWFELPGLDWRSFKWGKKENSEKIFAFYNAQSTAFAVKFHPPRIILFESNNGRKPVAGKKKWKGSSSRDLFDLGFLILTASFVGHGQKPSYRDLLLFNERFRYWRVPFKEHPIDMQKMFNDHFGDEPKDYYLRRWSELLKIPYRVSKDSQMYTLLPYGSNNWNTDAENWWQSEVSTLHPADARYNGAGMDNAGWICYADNRAFVWSCAIVENGAEALERMGGVCNKSPEKLGGWIKFLNIDPPGELDSINRATAFEQKWVEERYYDRWVHDGTLYGFNYHAGVVLADKSDDPPIARHFHDLYFDMTLLLLYLRITLFRFSRELTRLSADMRGTPAFKRRHRAKFKILRREFAIFTNLYQFPLISNQQQAIEMYALIRKRMDVEELFKEVEEEIKSSHEYFQFEEESKLNIRLFWLTVILGIPVAVIGALATIISIQSVNTYLCDNKLLQIVSAIICS